MFTKIKFLFLIQLFTISIFPDQTEEIVHSLLQEKFYQDKITLGKKLGILKSQRSSELLKSLLKNPYHWNREAAVAGLMLKNNSEINRLIINQYIIDPILRVPIRREISLNIEFFFDDLTQAYELEDNQNSKKLLYSLIVISPTAEDYILKKIQSNRNK